MNNLQTNYKTLNKKLNQTIADKDNQIVQLQQSLMRTFIYYITKI